MSEEQLDFLNIKKQEETDDQTVLTGKPEVVAKELKKVKNIPPNHFIREPHNPETCVQCLNGDFCSRREDEIQPGGKSNTKS